MLALKKNQGTLYEDVKLYFNDSELLSQCAYEKMLEKAYGGIEKREYWQTDDISWLVQKKDWAGLTTIGMARNKRSRMMTSKQKYGISSAAYRRM